MPYDLDDDEYVANLLKQDAQNTKKKYELVGIDAFNPKRARSGAPKPNTNFLRHIIRQTDSHNAALLAKEAEESNARLKQMNRDKRKRQDGQELRRERKAEGRLTPVLSDEDSHRTSSKRRPDVRDDRDSRRSKHRRRDDSEDSRPDRGHRERRTERDRRKDRTRDDSEETLSRRRDRSPHHQRRRVKDHDTHRSKHHSRRHYDEEHSSNDDRRSHRKDDRTRSHRHKPRRHSHSRSRSRSPRRPQKHRHRSRSYSPASKEQHASTRRSPPSKRRRSPPPSHSDSDPLEALLGPLPPPPQPTVRARGRGAHRASTTGIDSRFSSTYDPTADVHHDSDGGDDTWGTAVEAFRDRQRWKQQGAERLKAAGFTDEQVRKWERGEDKDEDDVTWAKRGQAREWDRGKVVGDEGEVEVKAEWGRLT